MSVDFSDERISAYLDGELTAAERAEIEALLASSLEHRQLVEELRTLRTTLQNLPRPPIASDFAERVMLRAMQATSEGAHSDSEGANGHSNAAATAGGSTSVSELALRHSFELRRWRRAFWSISTVAAGLLGLLVISNTDRFAVIALRGRAAPTAAAPEIATTDSSRLFRHDPTDSAPLPLQDFSEHGESQPRAMGLGGSDHPGTAGEDGNLALNQIESADSRARNEGLGAAARRSGGEPGKTELESKRDSLFADPKAANGIELQRGAKEDSAFAKKRSNHDRAEEDRLSPPFNREPGAAGNAPAPRGGSASRGVAAPGFPPSNDGFAGGGGKGLGGAQRKFAAAPSSPRSGGLPGTPQPDFAAPNRPVGSAAPAGQPSAADKAKATTEKAMSDEKDLAVRDLATAANPVPADELNDVPFRKRPVYVLQVTPPSTNTSPEAVKESLKQVAKTREPLARQLKANGQADDRRLSEQDLSVGTHVQVTPEQGQKFVDDMQRANPYGTTQLYFLADSLPKDLEKKVETGKGDAANKPADQVDGLPIIQPLNSNRKSQAWYALVVPDNRLSRPKAAATDQEIEVLPKLAVADRQKVTGLRALAKSKIVRLNRQETQETEHENLQEEVIDIILVVDPSPAKPVAPPAEPK